MIFTIYFIQDTSTDLLRQAHNTIKAIDDVKVIWIEENKLLKTDKFTENSLFVLGHFDCPSLKYLQSKKLPIFGPQCLLAYFSCDEVLPKSTYPIFSNALKDIHVCFSSITDEIKHELSNKIKMMHGVVSNALKANVDVLISSSVLTRKYRVAKEKTIPVVSKEWVEELWTLSKSSAELHATDKAIIDKYSIPILYNLKICLSGFNEKEREEAEQLIIENGGNYCRNLNINDCSMLIARNCIGQKFSYAKKWKIPTVSWDWLRESIEKLYACDVEQYQLTGKSHVHGSTPKKDSKRSMDSKCNEISIIFDGSHVDETRLEDNCDDSTVVPDSRIWIGCRFEFLYCTDEFVRKWEHLIRENGGSVVNSKEITASHIIVGDNTKLFEKTNEILYINSDWLQTCINENRLIDINQFIVDIQIPLASNSDNFGSLNEFDWDATMKTGDVNNREESLTVLERSAMSIEETIDKGIFHGFLFYFDNDQTDSKSNKICSLITENAGQIVLNVKESTHYILPGIFTNPIKSIAGSNTRLVTLYFIEQCIQQQKLLPLDSDFLFNPIPSIDPNLCRAILAGTVISFSGYLADERQLLKTICTELGAIVQDQMSRKAIPGKRILATTHLIISKPDKKKFPSSKSWGIPAVTKHWIGGCITELKRIDTVKYHLQSLSNDDGNLSTFTSVGSDQSNFNETLVSGIDQLVLTNRSNNAKKSDPKLPSIDETEQQLKSPLNENQKKTPIQNKYLLTRNTEQQQIDNSCSFSDMESPIYRGTPIERRPKLVINPDMFKTPEHARERLYPKPTESITTPQMTKALKSRIALIEIENKKKPRNYMDTTLSEIDPPKMSKPLENVVVYISKSLQPEQFKLREIIENLGGNCCWVYDSKAVTHVVCCSMPKENSPLSNRNRDEILKSVQDSKILVTSDWLLACNNKKKLIAEDKYLVNISDLLEVKDSEPQTKKRKPSENLAHLINVDDQPKPPKRSSLESNCGIAQIQWNYEPKSTPRHELSSSFSSKTQLDSEKIEKIFMFSNIDKSLDQYYCEQIKNLGGSFELSSDFCTTMTHLICGEPCLNEKYLAAIAAGKWVLHKSYLDESISAGKWLEENEFQWGGSRKDEFLQMIPNKTYGKIFLSLLDASKHWHETGGGAFKEWRVCLIEKENKYERMCKIIEAGEGIVVPFSEPISQMSLTHFLINKSQCSDLPDLSSIPCYKIEIIPSFLAARDQMGVKKCIKQFTIKPSEMRKS